MGADLAARLGRARAEVGPERLATGDERAQRRVGLDEGGDDRRPPIADIEAGGGGALEPVHQLVGAEPAQRGAGSRADGDPRHDPGHGGRR